MHTQTATQLQVDRHPLTFTDADVIILPIFDGERQGDMSFIPWESARARVVAATAKSALRASLHDTALLYPSGATDEPVLLLINAGAVHDISPSRTRALAGVAVRALHDRNQRHAAYLLRSPLDPAEAASVTEGAFLACFQPDLYRQHRAIRPIDHLTLLQNEQEGANLDVAIRRGVIIGTATNEARALIAEPGDQLTPLHFADRAEAMARHSGLGCEILDEPALEALGAGAMLAVSQGSQLPPRVVILSYRGSDDPGTHLALIGKGITFDSGGISIKPAAEMHKMKDDMGGAAAVYGAMQAIAELKPSITVTGILALAENMPGGRAFRPGDVIRSMAGKTIEVISTDAEGRLVLADALTLALQRGATHMVDVATLTGGCVVALGHVTTGLFGRPQAWANDVLHAAETTGERFWQLPLFPEYREQIKSDVADIKNSGGRPASPITAALFIGEFAGNTPWAHLDIAGTVWSDKTTGAVVRGPTGVGVRTLVALAEQMSTKG